MSNRLPRRTLVRVPPALRERTDTAVLSRQVALDLPRLDVAAPSSVFQSAEVRIGLPPDGPLVIEDLQGKVVLRLEGIERGPFLLDLDRPGISVFEFPDEGEYSLAGPGRSGRATVDPSALLLRIRGRQRAAVVARRLRRLAAARGRALITGFRPVVLPAASQDRRTPSQTQVFRLELSDDAPPDVRRRLTRQLGLRLEDEEYLSARLRSPDAPALLGLGRVLTLALEDENDADRLAAVAARFGIERVRVLAHDPRLLQLSLDDGSEQALVLTERLQSVPGVRWVQPDLLRVVRPHSESLRRLEHLGQVKAPEAWAALEAEGRDPAAVTVAVIDSSGISSNQDDLSQATLNGDSKIVKAWDFASGGPAGHALTPLMVSGGEHADRCATSAVGVRGNTGETCGVAPGARLIGVRIGEVITDSELAEIMLWTAGLTDPTGPLGPPPSPAADVLSCSFGLSSTAGSFSIDSALTSIAAAGRGGLGAVVAFSVGNSGPVAFDDPTSTGWRPQACHPDTIAVGACVRIDRSLLPSLPDPPVPYPLLGSLHPPASGWPPSPPPANPPGSDLWSFGLSPDDPAPYSQPGDSLDLVAPSHAADLSVPTAARKMVHTVTGTNTYDEAFGGTSHATAMVAGAAALVLTADPGLRASEVRDILRATARTVGLGRPELAWTADPASGRHHSPYLGFGVVDVEAAVLQALDPAGQPVRPRFVLRDTPRDDGTEPSAGNPAASPDLFVQQSPPPATTTDHSPPVPGVANHLHATVHNLGDADGTETVRVWQLRGPVLEPLWPDDTTTARSLGAASLTVPAGGSATATWPLVGAQVPSGFRTIQGIDVVWQPTLLAVLGQGSSLRSAGLVRERAALAQRAEAWIEAGAEPAAVRVGTRSGAGLRALHVSLSPAARGLRWIMRFVEPMPQAALLRASRRLGATVRQVRDPVLGRAVRVQLPARSVRPLRLPLVLLGDRRATLLVRLLDAPTAAPAALFLSQEHASGEVRGGFRLVGTAPTGQLPLSGERVTIFEDPDDKDTPEDLNREPEDRTCPPHWGQDGPVAPWEAGAAVLPPGPWAGPSAVGTDSSGS
jgi:hypothetical protein